MELIRPLLRITKCELLDYCKRNEVPYAVDSSNVDRHYFRNTVRLDLMPAMEQYNPQLQASLAGLPTWRPAEDDYMDRGGLKRSRKAYRPQEQGFRFERRLVRRPSRRFTTQID